MLAVVQRDPQKTKKGLVLFSNEMVAEGKSPFPFSMSDVNERFLFILPSFVFYNLETTVLVYDDLFDPTHLVYDVFVIVASS